jgi:hypothetical protein
VQSKPIGEGRAVPAFPDNLVVFPNRDFIAVEGYQDHVGETDAAGTSHRSARSNKVIPR